MTEDFIKLKQEVLIMRSILEEHSTILSFIKELPLSEVAKTLSVSRQALHKYVQNNFEPDLEYYKKNGKIYLDVCVLPQIRSHYEKQ
jgi:predicted DNA-binding protein YlxM (UPF0122 family)